MVKVHLLRTDKVPLTTATWCLGMEFTFGDYDNRNIHWVEQVDASGDELVYIQKQIIDASIPQMNSFTLKKVSWFGDDAKFIVANVLMEYRNVQ